MVKSRATTTIGKDHVVSFPAMWIERRDLPRMGVLTCRICGTNLSQLTIFEKGALKRHLSWCVNSDCGAFRVLIGDTAVARL